MNTTHDRLPLINEGFAFKKAGERITHSEWNAVMDTFAKCYNNLIIDTDETASTILLALADKAEQTHTHDVAAVKGLSEYIAALKGEKGNSGVHVGPDEPSDEYDIWVDTSENYLQSDTNIPTAEEYFDIDADGVVVLKPEYRGCPPKNTYPLSDKDIGFVGSKVFCLPNKIVIPGTIRGVSVTGLAEGMFAYNNYVEEIVIPDTVSVIPNQFCYNAHQLKIIANTEHITRIGDKAFSKTRIEEALFPNLTSIENRAFSKSVFLHTVDIGNVEQIDEAVFSYCRSLKTIYGGDNVKTICAGAFYHTTALKSVDFLNKLITKPANEVRIEEAAFLCSNVRFDWSKLSDEVFTGTCSTPISDNTTDFWSGIDYSSYACENPLGTLLNQSDARWKDVRFRRADKTWSNCCGVFSTLHIHSALSGNTYKTPMEYEAVLLNAVNEAKAQPGADAEALEKALKVEHYDQAELIYQALGYSAETLCGGYDTISNIKFTQMLQYLKDGAYVHLSIGSVQENTDGTVRGNPNKGHAVIAYGVTENGEIMIADSASGSASVGAPNEFFTYTIPFQNIMGPEGDIVVVKPKANNT